jgi:hypothetical protein
MTYVEATRQAEEDARWIRNNDGERVRRVERLARCNAIIAQALNIEPITMFTGDPVDNVVTLMDPVPVALEGEDAA